ncbi:hypothetical protein GG496_002093 [Candidatus Fervidibacteria bacterium JGI MDM2 JNZ-1-D12]
MRWCEVLLTTLLAVSTIAAGQEEVKAIKGKHIVVEYPVKLERYAKAFLQIGDAAWDAYRELYNLPLPEPIELQIRLVPEKGERFASLWTDGQKFIFLEVGSEKPLLAPTKGGAHNVYGICHELAHIAIYHRMTQVARIPEGIAEGWTYYFGSVITSHLFEKLGAQVYPDPHDYHETSGMARLLRQLETRRDPQTLAAKILYDVERKYGRQVLSEALNRTLSQRPSGHELVAKFVEALVAVTNDPQAKALVPEQFLKPQARIETEFPDITQKRLYYGLKMEWHEGLLQLRYDDGEKDGQWSIAGSGHGIIFVKPEGKWQLVAVEFYGARYGALQPPDEDFSIFLCNEKFEVIREFRAPYSLFAQQGEWKWERISVEPTEVPDFFYIVIAFNPTATKGIYMAYDADVPRSHSREAFPGSHLMDTEKTYDWMIRCYLKPADEQTAANAQDLIKRLQSELEMPKKGTVEPYPKDPVEVARKFMELLLSGKEQALAFSDEQLHQRVMEDLDYFGRFKDNPPRLLHARLAQRNERHDFFSRMAKRVVEIWKRGEICVAVWYAFPPFNQADTWFVALRKVNGRWQVSSFGTWGYAVPIPINARGIEVEKAFLKNVRWTGITDYSALGKAYYAPLPEDLAEAEKVVRQVLEYWQVGNDAVVLKLMHPKSKVTVSGNLTKFAAAQKQARAKMKGMKLVGLTAYRDTIVQVDQPNEFFSLETSLSELFGMSPEEALGARWLYARIAIFDAEFSDGKRSVKVRLFVVKEGDRWLLANLPM